MKWFTKIALLCLCWTYCSLAFSAELFTLTDISQTKFVSPTHFKDKTTIYIVISNDCIPCLRELSTIETVTSSYINQFNFVIVSMNTPDETRELFSRISIPNYISIMLAPKQNPSSLLAKLGNTQKILPFIFALNKNGTLCNSFYQAIDNELLTGLNCQ